MSTSAASTPPAPSRLVHFGLWGLQGLLGMVFLMAGGMKLAVPAPDLVAQGMTWVSSVPSFVPTIIGLLEVLGAVGLVLPAALRVLPRLTVMAAGGLTLTMGCAVLMHLGLGEVAEAVPALVLGVLASVILWGRAVAAPILPR